MARHLIGEDMEAYALRRRGEMGDESGEDFVRRFAFFRKARAGGGWNQPLGLSASFDLPFLDLGAGRVSILESQGAAVGTFTRAAATATTVGSNGLVIKAIAANVARSFYDPTALAYLGYLAEGARTNICLQSEDLATTWTNVASTESVNATTAPDGTATADKLIPDAAATTGAMLQTGLTLTADQAYTFAVFAKTSVLDSLQIRIGDNTFANSASVTYNTTTGAVESAAAVAGTWTAPTTTAKQYPNGWWRFTVSAVATTNAGDRCTMVCPDTGDGTNGIFLWGMQIENASFASSYIPTTSASVTRNADVLTYPVTGWFNAVAGTMFAQWVPQSPAAAANLEHVFGINDGTTNERYVIRRVNDGSGTTQFVVIDGGAQQALIGVTATAAGSTIKTAGSYAVNDFAFATNGGAVATDTSGTLPTVTTAEIGEQTGGNQLFGTISRISYTPARLTNGQLQAMTL